MAKKQNNALIETFAEFKETKNIDRATLVSVLEESFRSVIAKMLGSDENYDVSVNPDKGDFEIDRNRTVVPDDEVTDPNLRANREVFPQQQKANRVLIELAREYGIKLVCTNDVHF